MPQREVDRRGGDRSIPMRTPTMAGGLFSIDRDYFYEIGSYDAGNELSQSCNTIVSISKCFDFENSTGGCGYKVLERVRL